MPLVCRASAASRQLLPVGFLLAATTAASANLHVRLGDQDASVRGSRAGWRLGNWLSAGDVNGDGLDDLVSMRTIDGTPASRGAVEILFGRPTWARDWDLAATPSDVTILPGPTLAMYMLQVADVDGDGLDDVVAGSTEGGFTQSLWIWLGRPSWPRVLDVASAAPDVTVLGSTSHPIRYFSVGDVDADGRADLLPAPWGGVVGGVLGRASWPRVIDLSTTPPDFVVRGLAPILDAPLRVAEVTGDGVPDLVASSRRSWDPDSHVLVVPGTVPWPADLDVAAAPSITLDLISSGPVLAADVTGDGIDDLVAHESVAEIVVVEGGPALGSTVWGRIRQRGESDGLHPAGVGDLDRDGREEIVMSAPGRGPRELDYGAGEIVTVTLAGRGSIVDLGVDAPSHVIYGAPASAYMTQPIVGDFDGDGLADLAVSASRDVTGPEQAGSIHLFFGLRDPGRPPVTEVFVDPVAGDDGRDGRSWAGAKRTLPAALALLADSDVPASVRIAEGTLPGPFVVGAGLTLTGGHVRSRPSRNPSTRPTILHGGSLGSVVTIHGAPGSHETRLDGFVITGGRADAGGGVNVQGGNVVLLNCELTGNVVEGFAAECPCTIGGEIQPWMTRTVETCSGFGTAIRSSGDLQLVNVFIHGNSKRILLGSCTSWFPPDCFSPPKCPAAGDGMAVSDAGSKGQYGSGSVRARYVTLIDDAGGFGGADELLANIVAFNDGPDLMVNPAQAIVEHVLYQTAAPGSFPLSPTNFTADPLIVDRAAGRAHLAHVETGQPASSPARDAAIMLASEACLLPSPCLDTFSTRTDGAADTGKLDLGYHDYANQPPEHAGPAVARAAGECAIVVEWPAAWDIDDAGVTYEIHRASAPGAHDLSALPHAEVASPSTAFVDDAVAHGETWHYVVRARDSRRNRSAPLAEVTATATDRLAPVAQLAIGAPGAACAVTLAGATTDPCTGVSRVELHRSADEAFTPGAATLVAADPAWPFVDVVPANGLWHYRLVASDGAGNAVTTPPVTAWVGACAGLVPPPGRTYIPLVAKAPAGLSFTLIPAPGADFHRLAQGRLAALHASGYDHATSPGPDATRDTADDVGSCAETSSPFVHEGGLAAGDLYFVAVGVNAAGEGLRGADSFGRTHPSCLDLGTFSCP